MHRLAALIATVLAACSGGSNDPQQDAAPDTTTTPTRKRMFVTKAAFTGNLKMAGGALTGLDSADALCANAATAANLGGTWLAWIGDSQVRAGHNILDEGEGGWTNVSGSAEIFAMKPSLDTTPQNWTQLEYEDGTTITSGYVNAWTGPGTDSMPCRDWTTDFWPKCSSVGIVGGGEDGSGGTWQSGQCKLCTDTAHLYCFEQ